MELGRRIVDIPRSGSLNMAIDEWMMEAAVADQRPLIRVYRWSLPTLSLGYFQQASDRLYHRPSEICGLVRRHSGGGAIVHDRELTYSIVLPAADRRFSQHQDVYAATHNSIIQWLASKGVEAKRFGDCSEAERQPIEFLDGSLSPEISPTRFLCFERRSDDDLVVRGHKVLGSAQRRKQGALLQHGSLLFRRSVHAPELPGVNDLADGQLEGLSNGKALAIELAELLGNALGIRLEDSTIKDDELRSAARIAVAKFGSSTWTNRR